jgi:hypothetical protein
MRFHGWCVFVGSLQILWKCLECVTIAPKQIDGTQSRKIRLYTWICSGASESSTVGARDNATEEKHAAARSEALLAMKECEKVGADL